MVIHPTHTCFDDATYYIAWLIASDPKFDPDAYRIVHGICKMPDGTRYTHAWIENDGEVIDCGMVDGERMYYCADRRDYYKELKMQELIRYTVAEVSKRKTGGPWEAKYRELCRDYRKENNERKNT